MNFNLPNGEKLETWEQEMLGKKFYGIEYKGERMPHNCKTEEQAISFGFCAQWMAKILLEENNHD